MLKLFPAGFLALVMVMLSSCSSAPPRSQLPADDPLAKSATEFAARGDYSGAAQLYLNAVKTSPQKQTAALRLRAAEYLAQGQLWDPLASLLPQLQTAPLDPPGRDRYQLLGAELAIARQEAEKALLLLESIKNPDDLPGQGRRFYQLRAKAYALTGNPLEAARQLVWLDSQISEHDLRLTNQQAIWDQLNSLSDVSLQQLRTSPPPDTLSGWMELVQLTRQVRGNRSLWEQQLEDWRQRYPGHAAESALIPMMLSQPARPSMVDNIALLLPLSGKASESAQAIRDGVLEAWYADELNRPEIRIYDTAADPGQTVSSYRQAVEEGAQAVIGPLFKGNIEALMSSGELQIPVLALNHIDPASQETGGPDSGDTPLYQFGLAPENEAQQVADRLIADGHLRVLALTPGNTWGQRVYQAFEERFVALGGEILETASYSASGADFKEPIQQLMNLDASKARYRSIQRMLGMSPEYEPRRRQDVQAIFILGFPKQVRLLKPQLRFHHAGDIPAYSTSHVYSAHPDADRDRDLDGLTFCDLPWVLETDGPLNARRAQIDALWPARSERYQRLFALGIDAYGVLPWVETLATSTFGNYFGVTGELFMQPGNRLFRSLEWARFYKGMPKRIDDAMVSTQLTDR